MHVGELNPCGCKTSPAQVKCSPRPASAAGDPRSRRGGAGRRGRGGGYLRVALWTRSWIPRSRCPSPRGGETLALLVVGGGAEDESPAPPPPMHDGPKRPRSLPPRIPPAHRDPPTSLLSHEDSSQERPRAATEPAAECPRSMQDTVVEMHASHIQTDAHKRRRQEAPPSPRHARRQRACRRRTKYLSIGANEWSARRSSS